MIGGTNIFILACEFNARFFRTHLSPSLDRCGQWYAAGSAGVWRRERCVRISYWPVRGFQV